MKDRMVAAVFSAVCMMGVYTNALSQCREFKWPENRAKADECVAIWGDAMKQGNYRQAVAPLRWMMNNAPNWNTKLYIDAADVYDELAEKEKDPARKRVLVDSLLMIYDMRIKACGDEVNVMNRKAYASYKYNIKNKEKLAELLALYDKLFEMSGNDVSDGNLVAYFTTLKANSLAFKNVPDEQVFQRYDKIMDIIDVKLKKVMAQGKQAEVDKLKSYKDAIDGMLISMVKVDCDFVRKNLAPKFKQHPDDIVIAKKIFNFMLQDKCTDDPLWLEAGEAIHKLSPEKDYGLVKTIASKYIINGDIDKGEELFKEALTLAKTPQDKAETQMYLGGIASKRGDYSGARDLYRQSLASDPNNKEAWEKIGDLYFNSFESCSKKQSLAEDRLVYIAAYEMYAKAGNSSLMSRAKAQFPSKEEIFLLNWQRGSTQKVGCWINESVNLQTRD